MGLASCTGVNGGIQSSFPVEGWDFERNTYTFFMPGYEYVRGRAPVEIRSFAAKVGGLLYRSGEASANWTVYPDGFQLLPRRRGASSMDRRQNCLFELPCAAWCAGPLEIGSGMLLEASGSVIERRAAVLVPFISFFTPSLPLA